MTPPREMIAGQTFEVTSRAINRTLFFAPTGPITQLFMLLVGAYAKICGIVVYGVVLMSNHYHLLGLDTRGTLPDCFFSERGSWPSEFRCALRHWPRASRHRRRPVPKLHGSGEPTKGTLLRAD